MKRILILIAVLVLANSGYAYACRPKDQPETPVEVVDTFYCPEGTVPTVDVPESIEDCKETVIEQPPVETPVVVPVVTQPIVQAVAPVAESAPIPQPTFVPFTGK